MLLRAMSTRTWTILGVLAPLGMLILSGVVLLDLRAIAWDRASQTSGNLLQVIERDIVRNVEIIDLSLLAVVDNLKVPGIDATGAELRRLILFDRATTARDLGVMLVLDEHGDIVEDAGPAPRRTGNYADREYFRAHRANPGLGLHIGGPLVSRLTGERMIPLSRRIDKADGTFGGVVLCTLKLSYFVRLFDQLGLGRDGAINLYHADGTRIMRQPFDEADLGVNIAGTPNFDRFAREGRGSFVGVSVRDGVNRLYTFTRVGDLPLILNVAVSTEAIEAGWRIEAAVICVALLVLSGIAIASSVLFGREMNRRVTMEAELTRLSLTDALTGLPNRRRFQEELSRASSDSESSDQAFSLLVVDVDHFKRINDVHGHAVGDEVLKGIARCLEASADRPRALACRVGGEEFALVLPDTDLGDAMRVAESVHREVSRLALVAIGKITVSVGAATSKPPSRPLPPKELYRLADQALYEAKAEGRNQTRYAHVERTIDRLRVARQTKSKGNGSSLQSSILVPSSTTREAGMRK